MKTQVNNIASVLGLALTGELQALDAKVFVGDMFHPIGTKEVYFQVTTGHGKNQQGFLVQVTETT